MDSPHRFESQDDQTKAGSSSPPGGVGFRPTNGGVIKVQPPRREDLQPSYAQTLQGDDETNHGWYGGMSKLNNSHRCLQCADNLQSTPWVRVSVSLAQSHAV